MVQGSDFSILQVCPKVTHGGAPFRYWRQSLVLMQSSDSEVPALDAVDILEAFREAFRELLVGPSGRTTRRSPSRTLAGSGWCGLVQELQQWTVPPAMTLRRM